MKKCAGNIQYRQTNKKQIMTKIIDGKKIAESIKDKVTQDIFKLNGKRPNLAIILIGTRKDSEIYVKMKEREAKKIGVDTHLYKCDENIKEEDLLEIIEHLNKDDLIDAILVQLPLPAGFDTDKIISAIDPEKDADCFHPENLKKLKEKGEQKSLLPPVHKTVLSMLQEIDFDISGKKICVLCNSDIFGKSLVEILNYSKTKTEVAHLNEPDWLEKLKFADLSIVAIGKPRFIKKKHLKKDSIVIDVGTNKEKNRISGDVDFCDVDDHVSYISPVPGGVGPVTIAMLFENVLEMYKKRIKKE